MKSDRFDDAISLLSTVINQSNEAQNVLNHIKEVMCLIELKRFNEAIKIVEEIDMVLGSNKLLEVLKDVSSLLLEGIGKLTEMFIKLKCFDTTMTLISCQYHIIQQCCDNNAFRLLSYEKIAGLMERVVRETVDRCNAKHCKRPQRLLENILRDMMRIQDVDVQEKTLRVAWVYKYFAFACDEVGNFLRSVELTRQGITAMKTAFGQDAPRYKIYGHLYHNMAASLLSIGQTGRARKAYEKALDIYQEAEDWENQNKKLEIIKFTTRCLWQSNRTCYLRQCTPSL